MKDLELTPQSTENVHQLENIITKSSLSFTQSSSASCDSNRVDTEQLIDVDFKTKPWWGWTDNLEMFTIESPRNPLTHVMTYNFLATHLWHACRHNTLKEVRELCEAGAQVNSRAETRLNSTPLMVACACNKLDIVEYLIETCGADVNQRDANSETCLFYAVRKSRKAFQLIKYLLERDADTLVLNKNSQSVLELAVQLQDRGQIMRLLLDAQPNFGIENVNNALIIAAYRYTSCDSHNPDCGSFKFDMLLKYVHITSEVKVYAFEIVGLTILEEYPYDQSSVAMFWESAIIEKRKIYGAKMNDKDNIDIAATCSDPVKIKTLSLYIRERILVAYPHMLISLARFRLYYLSDSNRLFKLMAKENDMKATRNLLEDNIALWQHALAIQLTYCKPVDLTIFKNMYAYFQFLRRIFANADAWEKVINNANTHNIFKDAVFGLTKMCMHELSRMLTLNGDELAKLFVNRESMTSVVRKLSESDYSSLFARMVQTRASSTRDQQQRQRQVWHKFFGAHQKIEEYFLFMIRLAVCSASLLVTCVNIDAKTLANTNVANSRDIRLLTKLLIHLTNNLRNTRWHILSLATYSDLVYFFDEFIQEFNEWISTTTTTTNEWINGQWTNADKLSVPPSYEFINFLLECGAKPSGFIKFNSSRNTFLNYTMFESSFFDDKINCDRYIKLFVHHGAHLDYLNDEGKTLADKYFAKFGQSVYTIIPRDKHFSLKCLASRVVSQHRGNLCINYKESLFSDLVRFVDRH